MRHIREVSAMREVRATRADAKSDFLNAIWRAWWQFVFDKKAEVSA